MYDTMTIEDTMTICLQIKYTFVVKYSVYKKSKLKDTYIKIQCQ